MYDLVSNTGHVNGFHIEHILAQNSENLSLYEENKDRFETERNRLGGLLLLKGKDNISSNNKKIWQTSHENTTMYICNFPNKKEIDK